MTDPHRTAIQPPSRLARALLAAIGPGIVALYLGVILVVAGSFFLDLRTHRYYVRGIEGGLDGPGAAPVEPRFAVNVDLDAYASDDERSAALQAVRRVGATAIRQRCAWGAIEPRPGEYRWESWDRLMAQARTIGLQVIAVLDTSPAWARHAWEQDNPYAPPADTADLARFAGALAARYAGQVLAYQVWDEPNIAPHWGNRAIDPAGYTALLAEVSAAIRDADPAALVIAGGLAPNTEGGGANMSDVTFLQEIYRRGAGAHFDVLGYKAYGFWSGPYDRRVHPDVLNFSRVILAREEMVARGDGHKPIWAVEAGWAALPEGWQGALPAQGADVPLVQAQRLGQALDRIRREWPWMGLACMQRIVAAAPPTDPLWGFSLLGPDGAPTALFREMQSRLTEDRAIYPGRVEQLGRYATPLRASSAVQYDVWGSDIYLEIAQGVATGTVTISADGFTRDRTISLEAPSPSILRLRVARGLPLERHGVIIQGTPEQLATVRAVEVGRRVRVWDLWMQGVVGALLVGWSAVATWRVVRDWRPAPLWRWVVGRWERVPLWARRAAMAGALLGLVAAPVPLARLGALAVYGVLALLAPGDALLVALACIPLAPVVLDLGPGVFSLTEVTLLVAVAARVGDRLLSGGPWRWPRLTAADWAVLALALVSVVAAANAEYRRVAMRELRVVLLESALLYALVRTASARASALRTMVDVLWVSAVAVALYALVRYPSAEGVIEAEGVRRARAFYGSPNNLALYLERLLPLGLAMAALGERRRRLVYALGAIPVALATVLTFSRGALFLGVPAALAALAVLLGARLRASRALRRWAPWALAGALLVGVLGAAWLGSARLTSLVDLAGGTAGLRIRLWQASLDMLRDHPWLGVGPDNFLYYYGDYIRPGAEVDRWLSHPHNLLLDFWLRLGVGGVAVLGALLALLFRQGLRLWARLPRHPGADLAMVVGLTAGAAAAVAHGLADAFFFVPELALWYTFALAWLARRAEAPDEPPA